MQASLGLEDVGPARLQAWDPEHWHVAAGWEGVVGKFLSSPAGQQLGEFIRGRLAAGAVIYPLRPFRALELTPLDGVHAVIVGQDPYHGPGQAEGLAFSVPAGVKIPPSLRNIFKELHCDSPASIPRSGSLIDWARRGVLLLNTSLTVEDGAAGSHAKKGWEKLTDALLAEVAATASPCVYMLWGAHAQAKAALVQETAQRHGREVLVLQANHPSPLSASRPPAPFIGSGHFSLACEWLAQRGHSGIF
ncbi:MAG: uracil-DNA glycosylase [Pseudomonadota bacterium]